MVQDCQLTSVVKDHPQMIVVQNTVAGLYLALMLAAVAVLPACSTVKPEAFMLGEESAAPIGWFDYCQRVGVKDKDC
jgi:hypothetical protein